MPAACAIQAGYTIDCRESIGGLQAVFIAEFGNITTVTEVSGLVTGITKATGKRFYKFEVPRAVANGVDDTTIFWNLFVVEIFVPTNLTTSSVAEVKINR